MPDVPLGRFSRMLVRDPHSRYLTEDMWGRESAPSRLVHRAFKVPREIRVEVELDATGLDDGEEKLRTVSTLCVIKCIVLAGDTPIRRAQNSHAVATALDASLTIGFQGLIPKKD